MVNIINRHSNCIAEFSSVGGSLGIRVASTTLNSWSNYNNYRHSMYLLCRNICLWHTEICRWSSIFTGQVNRQSIEPIGELKQFTFKLFSYSVGSLGWSCLVAKLHGGRTTESSSSLLLFSPPVVFEESVVIYVWTIPLLSVTKSIT